MVNPDGASAVTGFGRNSDHLVERAEERSTLYGPEPSSFVPPITTAVLHQALVREVGYLREEIDNAASEWRDVPSYTGRGLLPLPRIRRFIEFVGTELHRST
jgi:hypothetical protein